jgi:hypothetical protein
VSQRKQQGAFASEVKSSERAEERPKVGARTNEPNCPGSSFCADNAVCAHFSLRYSPVYTPRTSTGGEVGQIDTWKNRNETMQEAKGRGDGVRGVGRVLGYVEMRGEAEGERAKEAIRKRGQKRGAKGKRRSVLGGKSRVYVASRERGDDDE